MKKQQLQNKYPIFRIEIKKINCTKKSTKDILDFLKIKIDNNPVVNFISLFDHFNHTNKLKDGFILSEIIDAKIIIFCFWEKIEDPLQLAVRPRSIGIAEFKDKFIISFLEAPKPIFNDIMKNRIKELNLK